MSLPLVVIAGPTAVGKSDMAVELALRFNGEIISADSVQLYKYFNIGAAKLTKEEQKGSLITCSTSWNRIKLLV